MLQTNDLYLGYIGGSGGYLIFHLLLLSGVYANSLNNDLDRILDSQWSIPHHSFWKRSEIRPDNHATRQLQQIPRLFFYCNILQQDWDCLPQSKLLVYTDLKSQLLLSQYKWAWLYEKNNSPDATCLDPIFSKLYLSIKQLNWPDCLTLKESYDLPEEIKKVLNQNQEYCKIKNQTWQEWYIEQNSQYKIGCNIVDQSVYSLAPGSDLVIKLQEVINSNGKLLSDLLDIPWVPRQQELVKKWKSLHPPELLRAIGIEDQTV